MTFDNKIAIIFTVVILFQIKFYKDKNGREPVKDFLKKLQAGNITDKKRADKINEYLALLRQGGTFIGEPYVKTVKRFYGA